MNKTLKQNLERNNTINFYIYTSPWIVGFLVFTLGPMLYSLYLSFTNTTLGKTTQIVGISNYVAVFKDELFYIAVKNTLKYSLISIPLQLMLAFFLASLLNMKLKCIGLFRTIFYLPSVIAGISTILLWGWIFNSSYGLLNYALSLVGITGPQWLTDPNWGIPAIIIMSLHGVGGAMLIFLAGLQNIPKELYESAEIDGANSFVKLTNVTLPLITPTLFFNLILGIIAAFQVFTQPYIFQQLSGSNTRNIGMYTYVMYLYENAFKYFKYGYGSAIAWILFLTTLIFTGIIVKTSNKWVFYSGTGGEK